jgi:hypothetical protein
MRKPTPSLFLPFVFVVTVAALLWSAPPDDAVTRGKFHDRPALILDNGVLELSVLPMGGSLASVVLKDDAERMNPMWDSLRADQESGRPLRKDSGLGHFICVDGFGPTSAEERAAGFQGHGEAHRLPWSLESSEKKDGVTSISQAVHLPLTQEVFRRTIRMADGENVVYVNSALESLLAFDRPICWAEHATIGSPFLEAGVTVVDISKGRSLTRPWENERGLKHRLVSEKEFDWPIAPTVDGGTVDLRAAPNPPNSGDHTATLLDSNSEFAWVTALHPAKRLLLGYVFRREEYPWIQTWESYPPQGVMARGLEFGSQAFDLSRRTVVTQNSLFGELLYRWLPAQTKIAGGYLKFWTRTPEGLQGVSEVEYKGGKITVRDGRSGKSLTLNAAQTW